MEEIKCKWSYSRDAIGAAIDALEEAMEALEKARAVCEELQNQAAAEALEEWDKQFPQYREG